MFKRKQLFALLLSALLVGNLSAAMGHLDSRLAASFPLVAFAADAHSITVSQQENGSATSSVSSAAAGSSVTITVTPNGGYSSGGIAVADSHNNAINATKVSAKEYSFTMPDSNVTVIPIFLDGATGTSAASVSVDSNDSHTEIPASSNSDIAPNSTAAANPSDSSTSQSNSNTSSLDGLAEPTRTIVVSSDGSTTINDNSTSSAAAGGNVSTANSGTVTEESNVSGGSSDSDATTANSAIIVSSEGSAMSSGNVTTASDGTIVSSGNSAMSNSGVTTANDAIIVSSGGSAVSGGNVTTANDGIIVSSGGNMMPNSGIVVANDGIVVSNSGVNPSSQSGIVVASDGIVVQDGGLMGANGSLIDHSSPSASTSTAPVFSSDSNSTNPVTSGSPKILSSATENEKGWSWVSDSKTVPNAQNSVGKMAVQDSVRAGEDEPEPTVKKEVVVPTKMLSVSVPLYLPLQTDAKGNVIAPSKAKIISNVKKGKLCVDSIIVRFSGNGKETAAEAESSDDDSCPVRLSLRKDDMDSSGELDLSYTNWLLAPRESLALNIKADNSEGNLLSETTAIPEFVFDWAD